jgi:hypothetical protein
LKRKEQITVEFSLPKPIPPESDMAAYYFLNDKVTPVRLQPNTTDFTIQVPALGGELLIGDDKSFISWCYVKTVNLAKLGKLQMMDYEKARKYKVLIRQRPKVTKVDFLSSETSRLGLGMVRFDKDQSEGTVTMIPGTYWVRSFTIGPGNYYAAPPFTKITAADQEVIDLTNFDVNLDNPED